jgi:ankyrin repeat protein
MANWSYYDSNGDKITVSGKELKELARTGKITPGTMVESPEGKSAPAKKVKGLVFAEPPVPPIENATEPPPSENDVNEKPSVLSLISSQIEVIANNAEKGAFTNQPEKNIRPKLNVDVGINFGELLAATETKTGAEKDDADAKLKNILLTMGGDINGIVHQNLTRLQLAIVYDDPELIAQLIQKGANVNLKNADMTPLHYAIGGGKFKAIATLIKHEANVEATNDERMTPLHLAIGAKNAGQVVPMLLKAGADPSAKDKEGFTPLHYAVLVNDTDILTALLKAGANINVKTKEGKTPLDIAIAKNKSEAAELLRKAGAEEQEEDVNEPIHHESGMTRLIQAVLNNDPKAITQLAKKGADVEAKNNDGATPLLFAVVAERVECVMALLEAGADTETKGQGGQTALHVAVMKENEKCIIALLKAGAKIDVEDNSGVTPLQVAEALGKSYIVDLLRNTKTNFKAQSMADMTSKERLTKGARLIKQRKETTEQIKTLKAKQNDPNALSFTAYGNGEGGGHYGCGCLFLIAGVLFLCWHAFYTWVIGEAFDQHSGGLFVFGYFILIAGGIAFWTTISNHYAKWKTDTLSRWNSELEQAKSELAKLNSALSWYDKLSKAERDNFDAAVRAEEKRQEEERKRQEQERRRRESICPQCKKEWALSTSWETVNTHSEFRTKMEQECIRYGPGFNDVRWKDIPIQVQTLVTTEREITKCMFCSFRREGASRQNRQEIR